MSNKSMSLKAKIRNMAGERNMSAQVVLQYYMFERFLERLLESEYSQNFILKGGMLIAAIVGIGNRATMDIDTTLKNYPLRYNTLEKAMNDICNIKFEDDTRFDMKRIEPIREDDEYGGFRVNLLAMYDNSISVPLQIDITTGDVITPEEELIDYKLLFKEETIKIWAYNTETILAEKVETIFRRGEFNTRPRDFYDIYIITKIKSYSTYLFEEALMNTALHRDTVYILENMDSRIEEISKSSVLKSRWMDYSKEYNYADEIIYDEIILSLKMLVNGFLDGKIEFYT